MTDIEQSAWGSYPKIYAVGHRILREMFNDPVVVEEKIDGSQFSFGMFDTEHGPELKMKSKGAMIYPDAPEKMFEEVVEYVKSIQLSLTRNWKYVGEYLKKPKHNTLIYKRIPKNHLVIFDICTAHEYYLGLDAKKREAARLGFETVPMLHDGMIENIAEFRKLLELESMLGGAKIEGFVIKNYLRFGPDAKALMAKFVSEEFKESHNKAWSEGNPGMTDAITKIGLRYQSQQRWLKAVQYLRDCGDLDQEPKDIGKLIARVKQDVGEECQDEIKDALWHAFGSKVIRIAAAGLPEWYKGDYLVKKQFEDTRCTGMGDLMVDKINQTQLDMFEGLEWPEDVEEETDETEQDETQS